MSIFTSFSSDVRTIMKNDQIFEVHEEIIPLKVLEKGYSSDLIDFASSKKYEKIIFINMFVSLEKIPEVAGATGAEQYLIRKKNPYCTVDAKIYDVEDENEIPSFQKKVKLSAVKEIINEMIDGLHQIGKKKIIVPDYFDIYHAYIGVGAEGSVPIALYSNFAYSGEGVAVFGGIENPYLAKSYIMGSVSAMAMNAKKSEIKQYTIAAIDIGAGYRYEMQNIILTPALSCGYLFHIVSSGLYGDPLLRLSLKASYPVFEMNELFAEVSYASFFEKKHTGNMILCSIGYQWNFEIKVMKVKEMDKINK